MQRILVDGDLAVVHLKASRPGAPDTAVADFYRIRDGRLVEHWDVLQPFRRSRRTTTRCSEPPATNFSYGTSRTTGTVLCATLPRADEEDR